MMETATMDPSANLEDDKCGAGRMERAVTLQTIKTLLEERQKVKQRPLFVADIGCGHGDYAVELAADGHYVVISDVSDALLRRSTTNATDAGVSFLAAEACDPRQIRDHPAIYKPGCYDLTMLLGPLSRITDAGERADVLHAALTMTQPGGHVIASFVTRNAHLRDLCLKDPEQLAREGDFYAQYLVDGKLNRGTEPPMHHTTPRAIRKFLNEQNLESSGFDIVKLVSCEGFLGGHHAARLSDLDAASFAPWLGVVLQSASQENALGAADHIIAVLRKR